MDLMEGSIKMEGFKGTPGPWTFEAEASNGIIIESELGEVTSVIADNEDDLLTELEWDNARLIAASPDLLSALQNLVHLHTCEQEGISSGHPTPIQWMDAVDKASEAISKALGGN
jgi:hypothetical protein